MNPATPVTTQTRGVDISCSRTWRYDAEITSSQWRVPAELIQGSCAREHNCSITRAAPRGHSLRRVKASSIPTEARVVDRISRFSAGAYEIEETPLCESVHCFVAVLPHSCGGRTTISYAIRSKAFMG
jgi:hypothetical protein